MTPKTISCHIFISSTDIYTDVLLTTALDCIHMAVPLCVSFAAF